MESPLQSWELGNMRTSAETVLLVQTATHLRRSPAATASGGQTEGYASIGTRSVRLEEQPIRNQEKELGGGQKAESWWVVSLAYNVSVLTTDRFTIDGFTYHVTETEAARGDSTIQNCRCYRVR